MTRMVIGRITRLRRINAEVAGKQFLTLLLRWNQPPKPSPSAPTATTSIPKIQQQKWEEVSSRYRGHKERVVFQSASGLSKAPGSWSQSTASTWVCSQKSRHPSDRNRSSRRWWWTGVEVIVAAAAQRARGFDTGYRDPTLRSLEEATWSSGDWICAGSGPAERNYLHESAVSISTDFPLYFPNCHTEIEIWLKNPDRRGGCVYRTWSLNVVLSTSLEASMYQMAT
ncbi:hypothetical protein GALMADRAFT_215535 [Galerina marginata CBS 339.88]|uniref:Uncharacterized protein n=1 Tax=Galerina marginata (strain CBS 339.88) TaxID=685588 RepID=A0A067SQF1_GALM3|nr:hypothetical protein GALMADRAFT_215535 [Galerina marginata CBS 339.88]